MGIVDNIKRDAKKSGQNKSKFVYFREGTKVRLRFLVDMDDGLEVTFHDSYEKGINVHCQEHHDRDCPYCDDESLRTRSQYVWPVWNYEAKEVQLFMFPVNNCSPVPALMAMWETYGTITDRDYVISVQGKQQNKTFSVVPMDKVKFRNTKAKPYSEKKILEMIDKAFPFDGDDDDEDERPKKSSNKSKSKKPKNEDYDDDYDYDDENEDWDDEDDSEVDYSEMSPKELFKLCKERSIDAKPKKPAKYYINLLEEYDAAQDDWDDEEDDDDEEWDD